MTTTEKLLLLKDDFDDVYSAGYEKGKAEGGGDSWYDTFWDVYQPNNGVCAYDYAFSFSKWNTVTLKPKYDITPTSASYLFYYNSNFTGVDLVEHFNSIGKNLDFSQCKSFGWFIFGSGIARIGVVDMSGVTGSQNDVFRQGGATNLHTIDKLVVPNGYSIGTGSFMNCSKLANITIEGTITGNFTISHSPLTVASMKSIITHLSNYSGTDKEFSYTVTFNATAWNALDSEGATSPNGNTWREYINDLGWNVG